MKVCAGLTYKMIALSLTLRLDGFAIYVFLNTCDDLQLYMMEEELQPCKECNVEAAESVPVVSVEPTL